MPEDPIKKLRRLSTFELKDRPGHRIYLVRVWIPATSKVLASAVEVEDAWVKSPRVRVRAARDGLNREETYRACAIDSVRIKLEQAGFPVEQLEEAKVTEIRRVTADEAHDIVLEYARKEGN